MKHGHIISKISIMTATLSAAVFVWAQAQPQTDTQSESQTTAQQYTNVNDNQIAEIMKTVNEAEIEAAMMAKAKANNPKVKEFANQMISEHTNNMKNQRELIKKTAIKPESNEVAKTLREDAQTKMGDLKNAKGAEFDQRYITSQIAMHQKVHDDLTQRLIPNAKNPQFKAFLQTTEGHVAHHLAKAKEIQSSLSK